MNFFFTLHYINQNSSTSKCQNQLLDSDMPAARDRYFSQCLNGFILVFKDLQNQNQYLKETASMSEGYSVYQ